MQRNENIAPVPVGVSSNIEYMRLMLEAGADVNRASERNGETALHSVASGSDTETVQSRLDHGANLNPRTKPGMKRQTAGERHGNCMSASVG